MVLIILETRRFYKFSLFTMSLLLIATLSFPSLGAPKNQMDIVVLNGKRCFIANGVPDHPIGKFPNKGNPNAIREQDVRVCVNLKPTKGTDPNPVRGTMGIAINGVQFRPNTAGFFGIQKLNKVIAVKCESKLEFRYFWRSWKIGS